MPGMFDRPSGETMAHALSPAELEAVAKRLGGASKAGSSWSCRCPVHEDRRASLSLSIAETGKLLWRCHAGCSQEAVREALGSRGLLPDGRDDREPDPRPKPRSRSRIVATYPYVDERGRVLFEVVRRE